MEKPGVDVMKLGKDHDEARQVRQQKGNTDILPYTTHGTGIGLPISSGGWLTWVG